MGQSSWVKQSDDGRMIINKKQAKVVKRIFKMYLEGYTVSAIAMALNEDGIEGNQGRVCWSPSTITAMLQNEKYKGDSLFQKTYTVDYLSHKSVKNTGQVDQYYIKGSHSAIIDEDIWKAVQLEMDRRNKFIKEHKLTRYGYNNGNNCPYITLVFCGKCGSKYTRQTWSGRGIHRWFCKCNVHKKTATCKNRSVSEEMIDHAIVIDWNSIVENRDKYLAGWEKACVEGNPLERLRAKQMIELTAEGKIYNQVPELTLMVLESIIVNEDSIEVRFLDGSYKKVLV